MCLLCVCTPHHSPFPFPFKSSCHWVTQMSLEWSLHLKILNSSECWSQSAPLWLALPIPSATQASKAHSSSAPLLTFHFSPASSLLFPVFQSSLHWELSSSSSTVLPSSSEPLLRLPWAEMPFPASSSFSECCKWFCWPLPLGPQTYSDPLPV